MITSFFHGVETAEVVKGPIIITEQKSAVILLIGTAPVHETKPDSISAADWYAQTVNKPILILGNQDRDAAYYFGDESDYPFSETAGYTIPSALAAIFDQGGTTVIVVNVFDPTVHQTDGTPDVALVTGDDIKGSTDGDGNRSGLQIIKDIFSTFGFNAKQIVIPKYGELTAVFNEALTLAPTYRANVIIDAPLGITPQAAIALRGTNQNLNISDYRGIICYPRLKYGSDAHTIPFSAVFAGVRAATDRARGYHWSPSNQVIKGIVGVERPLSWAINDPDTEVNLLNAAGIVTVINSFGTGYKTWGNRNSAYPGNSDIPTFMSVRTTADIIEEAIEYAMIRWIDHPLNEAKQGVLTDVNGYLRDKKSDGAIIDGTCVYLKDNNPNERLAAGIMRFNYDFCPPPPLEHAVMEAAIDVRYLSKI